MNGKLKSNEDVFKKRDCPTCNNTSVVSYEDEIYGMRKTRCPECLQYESKLAMLRQSLIPSNYIAFDLSDYEPNVAVGNAKVKSSGSEFVNTPKAEINSNNIESIKTLIRDKVNIVYEYGVDIWLFGENSCGKTLISTAMLKELILDKGYSGLYVTAEKLILFAHDYVKGIDTNYGFNLDKIVNVSFLVIDGIEYISDKSLPTLMRMLIIDALKKRKQLRKCCIITSTISYDDFLAKKDFLSELNYTVVPFEFHGKYEENARQKLINTLLG